MKTKLNFKKSTLLILLILAISTIFSYCSLFNYKDKNEAEVVDIVCGMKVKKSEAYISKYKGENYYFDTNNCKKAFEMNPQKFIDSKWEEAK